MNTTSIETRDGRVFDFARPDPAAISIETIAHALGNTIRFAGQLDFNWTVLSHSVSCAIEAKARGRSDHCVASCLVHDFAEAYVGDLPSPLKTILPDYRKVESEVADAINAKLDFTPSGYKDIDEEMAFYEARAFLPSRGESWEAPASGRLTPASATVRRYLAATAAGEDTSSEITDRFWKMYNNFFKLET